MKKLILLLFPVLLIAGILYSMSGGAAGAAAKTSLPDDYYEVLEIPRDASDADIKKAYKRLALKWHPDKNRDKDTKAEFQIIGEAYTVLINSQTRADYDKYGKDGMPSQSQRAPWDFSFFQKAWDEFVRNEEQRAQAQEEYWASPAGQKQLKREHTERQEAEHIFTQKSAAEQKTLNGKLAAIISGGDIASKQVEEIKKLLALGADPNFSSVQVGMPLLNGVVGALLIQPSVQNARLLSQIVDAMIAKGVNLNAVSEEMGQNAMMQLATFLIAYIDGQLYTFQEPVFQAYFVVIKKLVKAGASSKHGWDNFQTEEKTLTPKSKNLKQRKFELGEIIRNAYH